MSNSPGDATTDHTGRFVAQPNGRPRPLSPHLQTWRWHITMTASFVFRVTIGAASVGAIFVVAWMAAAAFGPGTAARKSLTWRIVAGGKTCGPTPD